MKCKDCVHFPVCCISDNPDSYHADMCKHKLLSSDIIKEKTEETVSKEMSDVAIERGKWGVFS